MDESIVGDLEVGSSSALECQQHQSFSWSVRNVAILASFCLVSMISFAALSMIAPFYPHEVSLIAIELFIAEHITLTFHKGYLPKNFIYHDQIGHSGKIRSFVVRYAHLVYRN